VSFIDEWQRPLTTTYPAGEAVSVAYNGLALPKRLASSLGDALLVDSVHYDAAGRLTQLGFPAGGGLVRTQTYAPWNQQDSNGGLLAAIQVGTTAGGADRVNLAYTYDSFGNVKTLTDNGTADSFRYDDQNRLLAAYGLSHTYDPAGRFTTFEANAVVANTPQYTTPVDSATPHAVKWVNLPGSGSTPQTVTIRAKGDYAGGAWPEMALWVNGVQQQTWTVASDQWSDYTTQVTLTGRDQFDIVYPVDYYQPPADRNLWVDFVQVGETVVQAAGPTVIDIHAGQAAFDGEYLLPGDQVQYSSGALRFVLGAGATALGYDANGNLSYKLQDGQADRTGCNPCCATA
jgi:hypothetical protein